MYFPKMTKIMLFMLLIMLVLFAFGCKKDKQDKLSQELTMDNQMIVPSLPDSFFLPPTPAPQDQKNIMKLDKPLRMLVLDSKESETTYEIFIACTKAPDKEMVAILRTTNLEINTITGTLVTARGKRSSIFAAMRLEIVRGMQLATQMEAQKS